MAQRLTTFSKFLITLLILGVVVYAGWLILNRTEFGQKLKKESEQTNTEENQPATTDTGGDDVLKVQIFTWGGYVPGLYFNEGAKPSEHSRFFKDYGLKVEFKLIDDFEASRNAWKADEVNLLGNEASAMATEMAGLGSYDPQVVMFVDWSRGGDAIVVKRGIQSMNDLRGKTVAVTPSTPSMTFLLWLLDAANMKYTDIKALEVPSAIDAATAFKAGKVDAALVWSPDDEICVREVAGSKVLQSTRQASNIIADIFMAKKAWVDKNSDKLAKFYEGWMKAVAEINTVPANKDKAARIMAQVTGLSKEDALASINNVRLSSHGDNVNFFRLNNQFKGVTGEFIYTKMGNAFEKLNLAPADRPNWRLLAYTGAVSATNLSGAGYEAEGQKEFKPVTEDVKNLPAVATKPISITFPSGSSVLDENAKSLIDLQFADIAKAFANARIRIEGNTDNTGSAATNQRLSLERAQAVSTYLEKQYGMNKNRFIIIGNGPSKPVPGCESNATAECKAKNRRTEFQIVAE